MEQCIYLYVFTHLIELGQSCFPAFVYVQLLVRSMDNASFNSIFAKSILCIHSPVWKTVLLYVSFVSLKQLHFQHCLSLFLSPLSFTQHHNSFFSAYHFSSSASNTSISYCVLFVAFFLPSQLNQFHPTCSFQPVFLCNAIRPPLSLLSSSVGRPSSPQLALYVCVCVSKEWTGGL